MKRVYSTVLLAMVSLFVSQTLAVARDAANRPLIAGLIERAVLPNPKLVFNAKLDTGADTSSINASQVEVFRRSGERFVRFVLSDDMGHRVTLERPLSRMMRVRSRQGATKPIRRAVVKLKVCLGGVIKESEFTLASRGHFKFQMLVGRNLLEDDIMIRSAKKLIVSDKCPPPNS